MRGKNYVKEDKHVNELTSSMAGARMALIRCTLGTVPECHFGLMHAVPRGETLVHTCGAGSPWPPRDQVGLGLARAASVGAGISVGNTPLPS